MEDQHAEVDWILERLHFPRKIVLPKHQRSFTCGRAKDNQIICLSLCVSRRHCIFIRKCGLSIIDLDSSNGIYINGTIQTPNVVVKLNENDIIGVGCPNINVIDETMFLFKLRIANVDITPIFKDEPGILGKRKLPIETECKEAKDDSTSHNTKGTPLEAGPSNLSGISAGPSVRKEDDIEILFSSFSRNQSEDDDSHMEENLEIVQPFHGNATERNNAKNRISEKADSIEFGIQDCPVTSTSSNEIVGENDQLSSGFQGAQVSNGWDQPLKKKSKLAASFKESAQSNKSKVLHVSNFANEMSIASPLKNTSPPEARGITKKSIQNTPSMDPPEIKDTSNTCKENNYVVRGSDKRKKNDSKTTRQRDDPYELPSNCRLSDILSTNDADVAEKEAREPSMHPISENIDALNALVYRTGNSPESSNAEIPSEKSRDSLQSPNRLHALNSVTSARSEPMVIEDLPGGTIKEIQQRKIAEMPEASSESEMEFELFAYESKEGKEKPTSSLGPTPLFEKVEKKDTKKCDESELPLPPPRVSEDPGPSSPIKSTPMKQEPTTSFSILDIVNLSDDEDEYFPPSQLFDSGAGLDSEAVKVAKIAEMPEASSESEMEFELIAYESKEGKEKPTSSLGPTAMFEKVEKKDTKKCDESELPLPPPRVSEDPGPSSPIKSTPMKQEPTISFSILDIVNLSDDDDEYFPPSQLFDSSAGLDSEAVKVDKHDAMESIVELDGDMINEREETEEVISLSDSDDEDDHWLEKLSRSQILNKNDSFTKQIKVENTADQLPSDDFISNLLHDESFEMDLARETDSRNVDASSKNEANDQIIAATKEKTKATKNKQKQEAKKKTAQAQQNEMEVDATGPTKERTRESPEKRSSRIKNVQEKCDKRKQTHRRHTDTEPKAVHQKDDVQRRSISEVTKDTPDNVLNRTKLIMSLVDSHDEDKTKETRKAEKPKAKPKKAPEIIEPPFLPKGEKRGVSCGTRKSTPEQEPVPSTSKIADKVEPKTSAKGEATPKLTGKQKKELEMKERIERKQYEKDTKMRRLKNKFANCVPPTGKKRSLPITKEKKLEIISDRKEKLKKIAAEQKATVEKALPVERIVNKPKAKITLKNRGDFLVSEQLDVPSRRSLSADRCSLPISDLSKQSNDGKDPGESGPSTRSSRSRTKPAENSAMVQRSSSASKVMRAYVSIEEVANVAAPHEEAKTKTKSPQITRDSSSSAKVPEATKQPYKITRKSQSTGVMAQLSENLSHLSTANRLPNASVAKQLKKKKKRVWFQENVVSSIREFEIEDGNTLNKLSGKDAPIPEKKLPPETTNVVSQCPKLEEFLLNIFAWNPVWLEEQQRLKSQPPIVNEDALIPLLTSYKTYQEYYKTVLPLLLLEVWDGITKEHESFGKNSKRSTFYCSIVKNSMSCTSVPILNQSLTTMILEILATKEEVHRQAHPIYGDLVILEISSAPRDGRKDFHKMFAYVKNMHPTVITPNTHYNKELHNHVRKPHSLLTYTVVTRQLHGQVKMNRVQRLRTITYLRSDLRMVQALQYLPASPLADLIITPKIDMYQLPNVTYQPPNHLVTKDVLNARQLAAVLRTTESIVRKEAKICLIQGPPGTGKSKVIVNMVMQVLYGGNRYRNNRAPLKILLCAPSNAAIDELVMRLLESRATLKQNRFKMVRVGRPSIMHPTVKDISVTELAKRDVKRSVTSYMSIDSVEEEKRHLEAKINALKSDLSSSHVDEYHRRHVKLRIGDYTAKYELLKNRDRMAEMDPREYSKLQRATEIRLLAGADIVACTLASCYTNQMESIFGDKEGISVCIVDEATQSCEAETLIPLMLGVTTLVLVGDPNQLPAIVISQKAKKLGLDQSLFSRLQQVFEGHQSNPVVMLDTQYRMDYPISYWPNRFFYAGKLKNAVSNRPLFPLESYRVLNLDSNQDNDKFSNTREAEFVANMMATMISHADLSSWQTVITVGVITPYQNQRSLINSKIKERMASIPADLRAKVNVEVNTVDSFQGQERDIIVMSCVRSNGIGFLSDRQRLCVALTRAKYSLMLCGNFDTFQRDQMWKALLTDAKLRRVFKNIRADAQPTEIVANVCRSKSATSNKR